MKKALIIIISIILIICATVGVFTLLNKMNVAKMNEYIDSFSKVDIENQLTPEIDVDKILCEIKSRYSNERVNDIDGVKIDFEENWVHLRKSNTEPIIRVYTEAKSMDEADALAKRFISEIEQICKA